MPRGLCGTLPRAPEFSDLQSVCQAAVAYQTAFGGLSAAGTRMPWHPVPRRAASVYLRAGALTCSRLIKLRLAYILCYFIRNRRWAYGFCSGFTRGEYHIALVDFICSLRGHQRTKEMDSAEPLSSILWTPPPHPGDVRCGGALLLPRVYRDIGIQHPVLSLLPSSEFYLAICVRSEIVSVSENHVGLVSFVFHYWMEKRRC